jgi:hypothetical protein
MSTQDRLILEEYPGRKRVGPWLDQKWSTTSGSLGLGDGRGGAADDRPDFDYGTKIWKQVIILASVDEFG